MPAARNLPAGSTLILRTAALQQLVHRKTAPLRLVVAGAGFGKSVLLDQYLRTVRVAVRCDLQSEHADFLAFLRFLAQKLSPVAPHEASALIQALPPGPLIRSHRQSASLIAIVGETLRQITARRPLTLALDDYHLVAHNSDVARCILSWVQPPIPQLFLILVARTDPALPLARLHAQGQVLSLGPADLAFSLDETGVLLDLPALSPATVAHLHTLAEGWPAGLRLILIYLSSLPVAEQDRAALDLSGDVAAIYDYLQEEALVSQPVARQRFLLESSLLPMLSATECDAILSRNDSAQHIRALRAQNLFIVPLELSGHYRYHHLFGAFLRDQAQHRLTAAHRLRITTQAATYLLEHGRTVPGMEMLERGECWNELAGELVRHHQSLLENGHGAALQHWLAALPAPLRESRPAVLLCAGRVSYAMGNLPEATQAFRRAARLGQEQGELSIAQQSLVELGHVLEQQGNYGEAAQSFMVSNELNTSEGRRPYAPAIAGLAALAQYDGRWDEALSLHQQALQLAMGNGEIARQVSAMHNLAWCYHEWGKLDLARDWYERSLRLKEEHHLMQGWAITANNLGLLEMQAGNLAVARAWFERSISTASRLQQQHRLSYALANLGELEEIEGDLDAAESLYQRSLAIKERVGDSYGAAYTLTQQARLAGRCGRSAEGLRLLAQARALRGQTARPRERASFALVEGILSQQQGDLATSYTLFSQAVDLYVALDARYSLVSARWHLAHALCQAESAYHDIARQAIAMANAEGYGGLLCRLRDQLPLPPTNAVEEESGAPVPSRNALGDASTAVAPAPLRLTMLGGLRVSVGERPVPETRWKRRRARALLAALALVWPDGLEREQIMEMIWPEVPLDTGEALFYAHLRALRVALEPDLQRGNASSYIQGASNRYTLRLDRPWDGAALLQHHREAQQAVQSKTPAAALPHWQAICALYSGPLLPESAFGDDSWLVSPREEMRLIAIEAHDVLATSHEASGAIDDAIVVWRGLLAIDDCHERAHGRIMRLLAESGRHDQARAQYQKCVTALRRQLDTTPSRWLREQAVALQIHS